MPFSLHFLKYFASSELHAKFCAIQVRSVGQMEGNAQIVNNNHDNDNKHANYNCLLTGAQSLIIQADKISKYPPLVCNRRL